MAPLQPSAAPSTVSLAMDAATCRISQEVRSVWETCALDLAACDITKGTQRRSPRAADAAPDRAADAGAGAAGAAGGVCPLPGMKARADASPVARAAPRRRTRSDKWADVQDSESDGELSNASHDAWADEWPEATLRGNLAGESRFGPSNPPTRHDSVGAGLNAEAVEFIPTMSMACPLATEMCLLEGTRDPETDVCWAVVGLVVDAEEAAPFQQKAPGKSRRPKAPHVMARQAQEPKAKAQHATERRAKAPQSKAAAPPEDRDAGGMPEASEETWQHRIEMRNKELASLEEKALAMRAVALCKAGAASTTGAEDELPRKPDPTDRTVSRRQWKRVVDIWFKALLRVLCPEEGPSSVASTEEWPRAVSGSCPEEGPGSVASTEEWQSLATLSTNCDGGSA